MSMMMNLHMEEIMKAKVWEISALMLTNLLLSINKSQASILLLNLNNNLSLKHRHKGLS